MVITEKNVVGVDIGGTHVRAGKVKNGEISKYVTNFIPAEAENPFQVTDVVIETIRKVFDKDVEAIGVGVPSLVDKEKGIVYDVQNIPSWKLINLIEILENEFKVNVYIDNDANCFALGENIYGNGIDTMNFVGLTMGTGIGAGIINNGDLIQDANCGAGEFGMLPYLDTTYEDYCSGKFFKDKYNICGADLYDKAAKGDAEAIKIFDEFGTHVGNIIKVIMFTNDPKKIIIGGSVSKSSRFFSYAMMKQIESFPYKNARQNIKIEFSEMMNSGILGAACLCFNEK